MEIAVLLFDGLTALDAIGPYEVLKSIPGAQIRFVAKSDGPLQISGSKLRLLPDCALGDIIEPAIVLIPGGPGARHILHDPAILD
jgi:putative intracellular protease/amidase